MLQFWTAGLCWEGEEGTARQLPVQFIILSSKASSPKDGWPVGPGQCLHSCFSCVFTLMYNTQNIFHKQAVNSALQPVFVEGEFYSFPSTCCKASLTRQYSHKWHCNFQVTSTGQWRTCWVAFPSFCSNARSLPGCRAAERPGDDRALFIQPVWPCPCTYGHKTTQRAFQTQEQLLTKDRRLQMSGELLKMQKYTLWNCANSKYYYRRAVPRQSFH